LNCSSLPHLFPSCFCPTLALPFPVAVYLHNVIRACEEEKAKLESDKIELAKRVEKANQQRSEQEKEIETIMKANRDLEAQIRAFAHQERKLLEDRDKKKEEAERVKNDSSGISIALSRSAAKLEEIRTEIARLHGVASQDKLEVTAKNRELMDCMMAVNTEEKRCKVSAVLQRLPAAAHIFHSGERRTRLPRHDAAFIPQLLFLTFLFLFPLFFLLVTGPHRSSRDSG
jgi:chromosome segregation ATPase